MTTFGSRIVLFFVIPLFVGGLGLYSAFLEKYKNSDRKLRLEQDFGLPFMLALLLVLVISHQTNNFTTSQVNPVIKWPKVKKTKKIIHKHIVRGNEYKDEDAAGNQI